MTTRYYHIYADNRTVKEISWEEWVKIAEQDRKRQVNHRKLARVTDSDIFLRKGRGYIWITLRQLKEIVFNAH